MLLLLVSLFGALFYWNNQPTIPPKNDDVLSQSSPSAQPETLGMSTALSGDLIGWMSYEDTQLGVKIKHPNDFDLKKEAPGSLTISNNLINIEISRKEMSDKDIVNTIAEDYINSKKEQLGDSFKLLDSISPIAIGLITGVTFSTEEKSAEYTYYYVPLEKSYLLIKDSTDKGHLMISDSIIYSLEILPTRN